MIALAGSDMPFCYNIPTVPVQAQCGYQHREMLMMPFSTSHSCNARFVLNSIAVYYIHLYSPQG